jgi:hypothetical protein
MAAALKPTFLDAYLVANRTGDVLVGVVRRDRHVWRIMRFGLPVDQQPQEVFATRAEAGSRLLELAQTDVAK